MTGAEAVLPRVETLDAPPRLESACVVLGAQGFQARQYERRGIGRYARCYVNALCAEHAHRVARIDVDPSLPRPPGVVAADSTFASGDELAAAPEDRTGLVYHVLSPFHSWPLHRLWPRWARVGDVALAVTLYDLIPLRHPEHYLDGLHGYFPRLSLLHAADAVLAISQAAAADAVELLHVNERRVHVVGTASPVSRAGSRADRTRVRLPDGARPGGILFITAEDWRKNTERLIDAYAGLSGRLRAAHPLTIVGAMSAPWRAELAARASALGSGDDVVITGEIADAQLDALRGASTIAVSPSLDEGFGLPVLEALEARLPAFVSDIPSHRALVPDEDARFDPTSVDAMRTALERALTDAPLRERLRASADAWAAPHTWSRVVQRSLTAYDAAMSERRRRRRVARVTRERLAIVTPRRDRLVRALGRHVDVDIYAMDSGGGLPAGARVHAPRTFGWHRELVGTTLPPLFCIGSGPEYVHAWRLLMRHRGDVLLDDVRLVGLYQALERRRLLSRGAKGERGLSVQLRRIDGRTIADVSDPDVLMVGEVVDRARRVYVHTEAAAEAIRATRPQRGDDVFVVPFALPPAARSRPQREEALIVSVGSQDSADLVLDATTPILRSDPAARLVYADPGDEAGRLRAIARSRGLGDRVELRGRLEDRTLLDRATVALHLPRRDEAGLSTGIAECIAAGVPTIATETGASRELPDDAVVRVGRRLGPEAVAAPLRGLLESPERQAMVSDAALRFARSSGAERAAQALLDRIRS